jgi:RHS repeat-associated protein
LEAFHAQANAKGMMTGSLVRNLKTNTWQKQTLYYDYRGRIIENFHLTNRNNLIRKDFQYRFNGELLKTKIEKKNGSTVLSTKILTYEYDHFSRKTKFKYSLNGVEKTIAIYSYDAVGRMSQKLYSPSTTIGSSQTGLWTNTATWQGANIPTISDQVTINSGHTVTIPNGQTVTAGTLFDKGTLQNYGTLSLGTLAPSTSAGTLQTLDFKYHIRGGLKSINADASGNLTNNIFSYRLDYEEGATGLFDGNIKKQYWKSNIDGKERSFDFLYDGDSRLKSGAYASTQAGESYSLNNVSFDGNGNITQLSRKGWRSNNTFGLVDSLKYTYNTSSNKILKVDDLSNETASFKDVVGNDYDYWQDGSLKKDNNKEITQIDYNYLKLPQKINLTGSRWIEYEYDASGTKLKKTLSTGKYTDYEEDEIYENGVLYQTSHDEGRIVDGGYEYDIKDHLGNTRISFKDNAGIPQILQVNHVGAWGESLENLTYTNTPKVNNFTVSTYEKENDFGIGVFDAHARMYDPVTPRFWSQDAMSERFFHSSTYNFNNNNPLRFIDPDGMAPGDYYGTDGQWLYNDKIDDKKVYLVSRVEPFSFGIPSNQLPTFQTKELPITKNQLIDMAAIAHGETSGDDNETKAFANVIKNIMDARGVSESRATSGNFSYAKSNNTKPYSQLVNATDIGRNGTDMQVAMSGALNAMSGGYDYSNGAQGWDGPDVLQGSPNSTSSTGHNKPENHYRQTTGGISDPLNLATTYYNAARSYIGKTYGINGQEYKAVQPMILNHRVSGFSPYVIRATQGASVFYDHR